MDMASNISIMQAQLRILLSSTKAHLCLFSIVVGALVISLMNTSVFPVTNSVSDKQRIVPKRIEFPLKCSVGNTTQTCPSNYPTTFETHNEDEPLATPECPDYFKWIHEDLRAWNATGITREMIEDAKKSAHFKLVIFKGKAYVEHYRKPFQTRDVFTIWGILQLLRKYPGLVPDLEVMINCGDRPVIKSDNYRGPDKRSPPPLFRYCGDETTLDIVFPDWSFWGWTETNIKPWESLLKDIKKGNKVTKWIDRKPYAYWKGNPYVSEIRRDLLRCNVSDQQDWNARLFIQDWIRESKQGYKHSNLANQCVYRYKIYIEGQAWSVSDKYILACDSVTLLVKPRYHDFFIRSLQPLRHYWPISDHDKCKSIRFAVDWGNIYKQKSQAIGKAGSDFMHDDLKMDNVYNYMFHLLNEYAKLLKFEPGVPKGAIEVCSETMACAAKGLEKDFKMESFVKGPSDTAPCTMPLPYETKELRLLLETKVNLTKQVKNSEQCTQDLYSAYTKVPYFNGTNK